MLWQACLRDGTGHTRCQLNLAMQVALGLLKDGTVAIQTALAQAQIQWPFLHDTSLISAVTAIFVPATAAAEGREDLAAATAAGIAALQAGPRLPWLYYNILLVNSALFVPVLDKVRRLSSLLDRQGCTLHIWRYLRCCLTPHSEEKLFKFGCMRLTCCKFLLGSNSIVCIMHQEATFNTVQSKFGPGSAYTNLHDRLAAVLLVATALSGESPGDSPEP